RRHLRPRQLDVVRDQRARRRTVVVLLATARLGLRPRDASQGGLDARSRTGRATRRAAARTTRAEGLARCPSRAAAAEARRDRRQGRRRSARGRDHAVGKDRSRARVSTRPRAQVPSSLKPGARPTPVALDDAAASGQPNAMPELPDVTLYVEALAERLVGHRLERVTLRSPFVLRTVDPPVQALVGRTVGAVRRLAKRIVLAFEGDLFAVVHLMRLGRFRWADPGKKAKNAAGKVLLATFEFDAGTLHLVEMGPKKRAALHVVQGEAALATFDPGGIEVPTASPEDFARALTRHNHTVKRALCDPRILAGIGNAY